MKNKGFIVFYVLLLIWSLYECIVVTCKAYSDESEDWKNFLERGHSHTSPHLGASILAARLRRSTSAPRGPPNEMSGSATEQEREALTCT